MLNSGSSSVKYQLVDPDSGASVADGIVERIGEDASSASLIGEGAAPRRPDRRPRRGAAHAFELFAEAGATWIRSGLVAVGHRVVHGGPDLYRPTLVDDALVAKLEELSPLAPLHNPPAVLGIEVARKALPDLPHVAVFDTAFFHDLPPAAATYAIDRDIAERWHIRRYGFHGTSHQYVSEQAAAFLDVPLASAEPDRAAPGQRRVGVGDRRRHARGHVDGPDADGGPGDGHPLRRHRPRRRSRTCGAPRG